MDPPLRQGRSRQLRQARRAGDHHIDTGRREIAFGILRRIYRSRAGAGERRPGNEGGQSSPQIATSPWCFRRSTDFRFPDFPGAGTSGDTIEEALARGEDNLAAHIEGRLAEHLHIPKPSTLDAIKADPDLVEEVCSAIVDLGDRGGAARPGSAAAIAETTMAEQTSSTRSGSALMASSVLGLGMSRCSASRPSMWAARLSSPRASASFIGVAARAGARKIREHDGKSVLLRKHQGEVAICGHDCPPSLPGPTLTSASRDPIDAPQDAEGDLAATSVDRDDLPHAGLGEVDVIALAGAADPPIPLEPLHHLGGRLGFAGGVHRGIPSDVILYTPPDLGQGMVCSRCV